MNNNPNLDKQDKLHENLCIFLSQISLNTIIIPSNTKKANSLGKRSQTEITSYNDFENYNRMNVKSNWVITREKLSQVHYKNTDLVCKDLDNKKAIENFLCYFRDIYSIEDLSKIIIVVNYESAKVVNMFLRTIEMMRNRTRTYISDAFCDIKSIDGAKLPKIISYPSSISTLKFCVLKYKNGIFKQNDS